MEEKVQETCSVDTKKCCKKAIIILVISCLICFFIGFYSGLRNTKIQQKTFNRAKIARSLTRKPYLKQTKKIATPTNVKKSNIVNKKQSAKKNIQKKK